MLLQQPRRPPGMTLGYLGARQGDQPGLDLTGDRRGHRQPRRARLTPSTPPTNWSSARPWGEREVRVWFAPGHYQQVSTRKLEDELATLPGCSS